MPKLNNREPQRHYHSRTSDARSSIYLEFANLVTEGAYIDPVNAPIHVHFEIAFAEWTVRAVATLQHDESLELLGLATRYLMELPFVRIALWEFQRIRQTSEGQKWMCLARDIQSRYSRMTFAEALAFHAPPTICGDNRSLSSLLDKAIMLEKVFSDPKEHRV